MRLRGGAAYGHPMDTLIVERSAGVVNVTMNRPERKNAANNQMLRETPGHLRGGRAHAR